MAQRSVPAPFLTKTYHLVDDPSIDDVISWNTNGTTFVVWKTADFAKDLLPNYFKHNNFSSFVRQLNTYGFRKIVPDKWEFANEYFRRGQKELLSEIRRRKSVTPITARNTTSATKTTANGGGGDGSGPSSPSNSGEDLGSTSTSSPDSKNPGSVETATQFADLSDENEKLKRDNEMLNTELAQAKKQCEELISFLTKYVSVGPDQINRILRQGSFDDRLINGGPVDSHEFKDNDESEEEEEEEEHGQSLKLFGVWLKDKNKKRGRDEKIGFNAGPHHAKEIKTMDFHHCHAPLMKSSKVCN